MCVQIRIFAESASDVKDALSTCYAVTTLGIFRVHLPVIGLWWPIPEMLGLAAEWPRDSAYSPREAFNISALQL